jgi:hypothetical protein
MIAMNLEFIERPTSGNFEVGRSSMTPENASIFFCRADS